MEAFDQYKQKGYAQKLKTDITLDLLHSGHQDFVALLSRQVPTHLDGMYGTLSSHALIMNNLWQGETRSMASRQWYIVCIAFTNRSLLICIPFVVHAPVSNIFFLM